MKILFAIIFLQLFTYPLFFIDFFTLFSFQTVMLIWGLLVALGFYFGFRGVIKYKEEIKMFMLSTLTFITSVCLLFFMYLVTLASM
ncbi:hypothetical protein [Bacillus pinisoli]|uniref:hypothetical protein n=1 Tax=Bacillus pinisoli TaxID=2901866 RepID=UPI001FF46B79|nr:hypothetical protein [Bacillus pinisoli]